MLRIIAATPYQADIGVANNIVIDLHAAGLCTDTELGPFKHRWWIYGNYINWCRQGMQNEGEWFADICQKIQKLRINHPKAIFKIEFAPMEH